MTYQVVASDYHMVRPEILRETLDGVADVTPAELGSTERLVDACRRVGADAVVTSHTAWYSQEASVEVNETAAADVRRVLTGEAPAHAVAPDWD